MKTIEEMTREITHLEETLVKVSSTDISPDELTHIAAAVQSNCREVRPGSGMLFYVLDDPSEMPADARVDFLYHPTYLAAAILICIAVRAPDVLEKGTASFAGVLRACSGRNFHGHGYESEKGLVDALETLLNAPVSAFLEKHADVCPEFSAAFSAAIEELRGVCGGTVQPTWGKDENLVRRAKQLWSLWENSGR